MWMRRRWRDVLLVRDSANARPVARWSNTRCKLIVNKRLKEFVLAGWVEILSRGVVNEVTARHDNHSAWRTLCKRRDLVLHDELVRVRSHAKRLDNGEAIMNKNGTTRRHRQCTDERVICELESALAWLCGCRQVLATVCHSWPLLATSGHKLMALPTNGRYASPHAQAATGWPRVPTNDLRDSRGLRTCPRTGSFHQGGPWRAPLSLQS